MSNEWDQYATDWDNNPSAREYAEKAYSSLSSILDVNGLRILDFGAGTGLLSEKLATSAREIIAIDNAQKMIEVLNAKNISNIQSLSELISEELVQSHSIFQEKFDLIVASSVCSFLTDYETTVKLLSSLLKDQGVFVQWDWHAKDGNARTGLTEEKISAALAQTELKEINIAFPFSMDSSSGESQVIMASGHRG